MNESSMPDQHKSGHDSCQGGCPPGSRAFRSVSSLNPQALASTLNRWRASSRRYAAFCRRVLPALVLLIAYGVETPHVFADMSKDVSASLRTEDHVHVTANRESPASGAILIMLRIDPGYHVNANPASNEYLIPTSVAFSGSAPVRIVYPPAARFKPVFADEPINVYEGTVVIAATFSPGALDRAHDLDFTVTAQACTARICLPPDDIPARVTW